MRLTFDIVQNAQTFLNPLLDREIDLRGYKIPVIENLGATQNQFDAINLSDNEIKKLDNFPNLPRLTTLNIVNNHISKIADELGSKMPALDMLLLTSNRLTSFAEVLGLAEFDKLILSLLHNPVTRKQHYRHFLIHIIPSLKVLDFSRVKKKEREEAARFFATKEGKTLLAAVSKARKLTPGEIMKVTSAGPSSTGTVMGGDAGLSAQDIAKVQKLIESASTPEQIDALERALKSGRIPDHLPGTEPPAAGGGGGGADETMEEPEEAATQAE